MPKPPAEAYPSLDAAALEARFSKGERHGEWTYDAIKVGSLVIDAVDASSITISFEFRGFAHLFPASGTLRLMLFGRAAKSVSRPLFICPKCGTTRSKLFLVRGEWGCRVCFALANRSTREGSLARLWRKKVEISATLAKGRPKRMRHTTHERLLARLERVTDLIDGRRFPRPNETIGSLIQATWSGRSRV